MSNHDEGQYTHISDGYGGRWAPVDFHNDQQVNALLNIAAGLHQLAAATNGLLYGLKYGKEEGMSVAESVDAGLGKIADAIDTSLARIADEIAEAK